MVAPSAAFVSEVTAFEIWLNVRRTKRLCSAISLPAHGPSAVTPLPAPPVAGPAAPLAPVSGLDGLRAEHALVSASANSKPQFCLVLHRFKNFAIVESVLRERDPRHVLCSSKVLSLPWRGSTIGAIAHICRLAGRASCKYRPEFHSATQHSVLR